LIDAHAENQPAIIASNKYSYSVLTAQSVTVTIVNDVIAPSEIGTWVLRVDAYVIGRPSGTALASNQQQFNVQVVPYTPTTTISMITTTTSLATTPMTTLTSQQAALPTSTVTSTSTVREFARQDNSLYYAAIFILLIAVIIIILLRQKKRSMKDKTRVWDVNPEGSPAA
jgi:cbb3-type cytochrome oxidase subunit 3